VTTAQQIIDFLTGQGHELRLANDDQADPAATAVETVEVDDTAGLGALAWSKRQGAARQFAGTLLLCTEEATGEPPPVDTSVPARLLTPDPAAIIAVCKRPRLAIAETVWQFFRGLTDDRPGRFHDAALAARAESLGAWVMNAFVSQNVRLGPHCSIGCAGMGYERRDDGTLVGFPQMGCVLIEPDVDIAAHATIQRGALGETRVCRGARIGPHVNVGHNVHVGRDVLIAGHAQIGGGARIGAGAVLWQSCAIANGVTVGEGAVIGMGAQVRHDVAAGETWVGNPARPLRRE
jgi:acetyltransferase-like isoleucine patch superfamily enzyme